MYASKEMPYGAGGQADLKRLAAGGGHKLGNSMTKGEYVLQVIVTDLAKAKPRVGTQWSDFEVNNQIKLWAWCEGIVPTATLSCRAKIS